MSSLSAEPEIDGVSQLQNQFGLVRGRLMAPEGLPQGKHPVMRIQRAGIADAVRSFGAERRAPSGPFPLPERRIQDAFIPKRSNSSGHLRRTYNLHQGGDVMERRHFLKVALGVAAGAAALAASAQAAPLSPHSLHEDEHLPATPDARPAVSSGEEADRLKPEQVHWGRRWHRRWHRRHWGWHHRRRWHRRHYW
jgi:hypothetical protein